MLPSISVLTLNIHKGFSRFGVQHILPKLREQVRAAASDIVFLQEVIGTHAGHAESIEDWPSQSQYEFLADQIWSDYAYGKNSVYEKGHHGNALLSKFPISKWKNFDVSMHSTDRRGALLCEITIPNTSQTIFCICVHLALFEGWRKRQYDRLFGIVNEIPKEAPLIVAGDFNDWNHKSKKHFSEPLGLKDVFEATGSFSPWTFPSWFPLLSLDRILVRGFAIEFAQVHGSKEWSRLSDHLPLATRLKLIHE